MASKARHRLPRKEPALYASLLCLFILGCFIQVVGAGFILFGPDERHWGVVAVMLGSVMTLVAATLMDGVL